MINPFTTIFAEINRDAIARLNRTCPVQHRVCHDELDLQAAITKDQAKKNKESYIYHEVGHDSR